MGRVRNAKGTALKPQRNNSGYLIVHLYRSSVRQVALVHRLVAQVFCPITSVEVNHVNGDKHDNRAENLEWMTRLQNVAHARATGLAPLEPPMKHSVVGTPVGGGLPVTFPSQMAAEIALAGRASSAVHHCLTGKKKSAYGYTWRRA